MMNVIDIPDKGTKKRIVIVGGGFSGLKLARKLKKKKLIKTIMKYKHKK